MGYILGNLFSIYVDTVNCFFEGKAEGQGKLWHGHVTAVTVSPDYRRIGLASRLMNHLEKGSEEQYNGYFVDLFVRVTNVLAQIMYTGLDYHVYRRVLEYYSGEEDAFDMRKALARDKSKESIIPLKHPITPDQLEW